MVLLVTYVSIALGFSFLCSLLEATLLSVNSASVHAAKQRGEKWADTMSELKEDVDKPLSAILTLNTIAHTMGAAGAGAQWAIISEQKYEAAFAGALTLAILVFTEIIPKTVGARYAISFAPPTAWFLPKLQFVLGPLVWLCGFITRLITFGGVHGKPKHREVLLAAAMMGEEEGELKAHEGAVVRNILKLRDVKAEDIMTPRSVIMMAPKDTTVEDFTNMIKDKPFSRVPVFKDTRDHITGVVLRSEALVKQLEGEKVTLEEFQHPLRTVAGSASVESLLKEFLSDRYHMMLVEDRYNTMVGLVTLEDVLETIVGVEILDETDKVADMQTLARDLWKKRAQAKGLDVEASEASEAEAVSAD